MNKELQRERHVKVNAFLSKNEVPIMEWCESHGLKCRDDEDKPYVLSEAVGRILVMKALKNVSGDTCVTQMPIDSNYDMETSEGLHIEVKMKYNDSDEYPTDDITLHKGELNYQFSSNTQVIIPFYDGTVRCYDMFKPYRTDLTWDKHRRTVVDSPIITESKMTYRPEDVIWETTITMPDWDSAL